MVETRRGKRKKENPQGSKKKEKSAKKAKYGAMEKKTTEKSETTALEKTSDVSAPINVLVDVAATVDARDDSELRKSDLPEARPAAPVSRSGELEHDEANVGEEKSAASDEDNKVDDGEEKSAASNGDVEGEEKSDASDEDVEGEEESEEEVGEKGLANNVEESGDDSAGQGDGGVGAVRQETANEEGGRPAEEGIDSIIPTKTPQERTLLDDILEDEDDVDKHDIAVDSWEKRLDEALSIFFKDMFDEDVAAREKHAEEIEDAAGDGVHLAVQSIEQGEGMKMLKTMLRLIKRVDKKVDQLDEILVPLEAFVKDVEKQKQRKK
ncbi:PREDICTED: nucleolin 2-like [Brassica oleracea var. oleracea]|uniref:nucleolin 2-like n=1 Tax=Brassica oleracea var. oleracea TaxID=109376 RepID=UPI0006A6F027|nr:PREDICTED: nucleolin 2-like [Brassica oleracea var. oleracea]